LEFGIDAQRGYGSWGHSPSNLRVFA
jgi:hypothetical protein